MALPAQKLSLTEFLDWENAQESRNEFYNGEVFAMVGGRRVHSVIALNLAILLQSSLKGTRCRTFVETRKVQLASNAIFYPDVFVTCDASDQKEEMVCRHPSLIAAGKRGQRVLSKIVRAENTVDYYDRESTDKAG